MRVLAWLCFAVAAGALTTWLAHGRPIVTMTERLVTEKVVDEFGDTIKKAKWEPAVRIGLLDVALPAIAVFGGLGAVFLVRARRASRRA